MRKYKVAHLTSVHPVYDTRIFYKECLGLVEAGYDVVLIGPYKEDERTQGVKIKAIPELQGRINRITKTLPRVFFESIKQKAKIYHFHDPELIPVGIILRILGKKVIYDVHEDLPRQILHKHWIRDDIRKVVSKATELVENLSSRLFSGIVAATPTIQKRFPVQKTALVRNFPKLDEFESVKNPSNSIKNNEVVYVGAIAEIRGIKELVQAISKISPNRNIKLKLAGNFSPPELEAELEKMPGWGQVEYVGWKNRQEIVEILAGAKAGMVTLQPAVNYKEAYPVKMFEYMAAGLPVIASKFPLWEEIIQDAGCGLLVNPLDPDEIANAICWIIDHKEESRKMGQNGASAVVDKYSWESEKESLLMLYEQIIGKRDK